jgi:hypothetical protein
MFRSLSHSVLVIVGLRRTVVEGIEWSFGVPLNIITSLASRIRM